MGEMVSESFISQIMGTVLEKEVRSGIRGGDPGGVGWGPVGRTSSWHPSLLVFKSRVFGKHTEWNLARCS